MHSSYYWKGNFTVDTISSLQTSANGCFKLKFIFREKKLGVSLNYILLCGSAAAVLPVLRSGSGYDFIEATINETSAVSFAISLTSTESNVLDRRHCPVFVKCYETEALNGPYSVSLRLGSLSIPDFEFLVSSNFEFISDVGGMLDLSPKGRIAMESLILFQTPSEHSTTGQPARSCSDLGCEESGALFMSFDDHGKTSYDDNFVRLFPHSDSDETIDTCTNNTVPAGCCPICNPPIQPDDVTVTFSRQKVAIHSNGYIRNGPPRRTAEPSTPHISRGLRRITSINSIGT